jgi:hypothetical protein
MRAIDVDGDNDIDVVSAEDTPEQLMWYENNGNEIFGARDIAGAGSGASVAAIDFDNDGDVDVLSSSISDVHGVLALHENNGNQVFGVRILADHAFRSGTVAIHAADLDSDGDVDVVGAWFTEGIVSWFENPTN